MTILVRKALIKDIQSPHHNQIKDIFIADGKIIEIDSSIKSKADKIFDFNGAHVSPGWVDIFVSGTDPGYEFKDSLDTLSDSAESGGFTHLFLTPNTNPVTQNKGSVEYIKGKKKNQNVCLHPLGAVTKNTEGKELTEMYDMQKAGAIGFSDGNKSIQSAGLLIKALQYIKSFNGVLIQLPDDCSVAPHGLMNEGVVSTQVGLPGKPGLAEEIMIARDIKLAAYTGSHLHITGVSLASSVDMIRKAKAEGICISASCALHHLVFTENELLQGYPTQFKLNPPLRSEHDRLALVSGVKDGTIDCITSHHTPQHKDAKVCEFEYALPGALGLEAAWGVLNTTGLSEEEILQAICYNPRRLFGIGGSIAVGSSLDLTVFDNETNWILKTENLKSKSSNCPYLGMNMKGKVHSTLIA